MAFTALGGHSPSPLALWANPLACQFRFYICYPIYASPILTWTDLEPSFILDFGMTFLVFFYILCRLVLLVLPFLCLGLLPPAAYLVVHWTSLIPHVWSILYDTSSRLPHRNGSIIFEGRVKVLKTGFL